MARSEPNAQEPNTMGQLERPPWTLPDIPTGNQAVWRSARLLSDEPEKRWTFTSMIHRSLACSEHGLSFTYENLSRWDDVIAALVIGEKLRSRGIAGLLGLNVALGFDIFDGALRSPDGRLTRARKGEPFRGRHSVAAERWDPKEDSIIFVNNWGARWGKDGKGSISREYFENHVDSAALLRPAWIGPSPKMDNRIRELSKERNKELKDPDIYLDAWMTPNRPSQEPATRNGHRVELAKRMLYRFSDNTPLEVVEARENGRFVGRMHILHSRKQRISSIEELWIHPAVRRQGHGSTLTAYGVLLARRFGSRLVRLLLHEADASELGIERAKKFAGSLGCEWMEYGRTRPNWRGQTVLQVPPASIHHAQGEDD
ncbi:GNAT family N-acetyltransferase [Actinacidiphila acididurans]|uniref:GNAT family N-acetyltransferase n=1 Tax=Actinacidiphila acididurans TaxID=2784346 RepID=A0ABS2TNW8_9ACTN|nr:GNAT family N-acetyltransferase [Actinacidiphila acididurans]MBM9505034.1 GNAT family N-acetyltransferase [Actinacidiphila acididurans]